MFAAAQVHEDLEIDCTRRIDVYGAIQQLGIQIMFRPLKGCAGAYFPKSSGAPGILLHAGHPPRLQRYTAAHELGHHVLEHGHSLDSTASMFRAPTRSNTRIEMLAEAFAAWFLMPPELMDELVGLMGLQPPFLPWQIYALSLRLGASYTATCLQLSNLRMISPDETRRLMDVTPRAVKEQISMGAGFDRRRDVWLIDEATLEEPLNASPGDAIVLRGGDEPSPYQPPLWANGGGCERVEAVPAHFLASFQVPTPEARVRWDVEFVDERSGAVKAAVRLEVDPPRNGLLTREDTSGKQMRIRVVVEG